jgi:hypothetical protein
MGRTFLRQAAQVNKSLTFADTLSAGATLESSSTSIEGDLNSVRSQLHRILDATVGTHWYNDVATVNSKKRGLLQLNTNLDAVEVKRMLLRSYNLTDIAISGTSAVAATGSITVVAKASLVDGDLFTIKDGTRAVAFYFDVTGSYTPGGGYGPLKVRVNVSGCTDATSVRDVCITAINAATIDVTTSIGGSAIVTVTHDYKGAFNYTITEAVANAGFTVSGLTSGVGGSHTLVQASGETPTETAAVGTGTALGALVALLEGDVGKPEMAVIAGVNAENPKNLCLLHDAATGDAIMDGTHEIYALLQAETGVVDGDTFSDTTKQAQLSFVISNATNDGLEWANADLLVGKTIHLAYVRRTDFLNLPEQAFLAAAFSDQSASVDVTLNNAIDNQSTTPASQQTDVYWRIDDTKTLNFQTSNGDASILSLKPASGGNELEVNCDTLDVNNALDADFLNGSTFDSGGTPINVGVTAGQIDAAASLTLAATGAGSDLHLSSADLMDFTDGYYAASTYDTPLVLSDSAAEWSAFDTAFGEVSLLNAITAAASKTTLDQAVDNQIALATAVTQIDNQAWKITDSKYLSFQTSDGGVNLLSILPGAAGDEIELNLDTLDINNVNSADFLNGAIFDSGGTPINVGVTASQIDATALKLASTSTTLKLVAATDLFLTDSWRAGSSWSVTDGIKLAATSAEWSAFETQFGEVSLLSGIVQAATKSAHIKGYAATTGDITANDNVTGAAGSPNLDAQLPDYDSITFVEDVNVFLNGQLLRNGANASANHDVYPGTDPTTGDLMFEFDLKTGDVLTLEVHGTAV